MDHDPIWNLALERMQELQQEAQAQRALAQIRARRKGRLTIALAKALCRLGRWMVSLGHRLECYQMRMVRQA